MTSRNHPSNSTGNLDANASSRLRKQLDHTLRMANKAEQRLREAGDDDDDTAGGITQLIEEALHKHDAIRSEMGTYGMTAPITPSATDGLSAQFVSGTGRKMQMERQVGDIQEACKHLQEMMDMQGLGYDVEEGRGGEHDALLYKGDSGTTASRGLDEDESDEDDDDDGNVMTPRGVYVQRCLPLARSDVEEESEAYKGWTRITSVNFIGLGIFLLYLVVSVAYIAARAYWSLDGLSGSLKAYGAIVLTAEILSILSLVFYGIWLGGKTSQVDVQIADVDGRAVMRRLYVVRVFIVCKDESLALVRRTISSVKNAYPTEGCERKLYLLDEGKDNAKRDFFMGSKSGADVIYIAPPVRHSDEKVTNWRSEIMNFTLGLIYPDADDEGEKNISISELVCVINADQTCSSSFFVNLLKYMDSGDNVAAAICPRICYDVEADCDIFDHQRVAYYEKAQLGMDAYGFTACMFTNMLLRARALQEIGWFPSTTLSENFEMGMLMRSYGWKSRYVPEYSTIGRAPIEICTSIDAHYASSRGYFQSFWSARCPLLTRGLGLFFRLMYSSPAFLAFASGVWTPIFTLVPLIHLIFGLFPLTFTREVVATMIAHYSVRVVMLHYGDSLKQIRALWLSRVAVSIYWWADLKAAFFIPLKRALGAGTSFRSRSWSSEIPIRNVKAIIVPFIFVVASLVAFIGGALELSNTINLPTVLSLNLVIINFAPPALLLLHWVFSSGRLLSRFCTLFMALSWAAGIAAMVFLWLLWPRSVDFRRAAELSLDFLDAVRSGPLPQDYNIAWRQSTGSANALTYIFVNSTDPQQTLSKRLDLSGGFYNDGQIGPVKVTWNIAMTTTMLAWSMLEYEDFWTKDVTLRNHALSLVVHGLTYVEACYHFTPIVSSVTGERDSSNNDIVIYVVGNVLKERQQWNRPEDLDGERQFVGIIPLSESPSDLAGQIVAALISGSLALNQYGELDRTTTFAFANSAHRLFRSAIFSPGIYTDAFNGTDTGLQDVYPSFDEGDDLFWAASWLFRAGNANIRAYNLTYYTQALEVTLDVAFMALDEPGIGVDYVNNLALVHAATQSFETQYHLPAQSFIYDWICDREQIKYTRNGRAYHFRSPHLGETAAAAAMAALYIKKNKDWRLVSENPAMIKGFQCFAAEQARYLLGGQLTGYRTHKPFMIGYNDRQYTRTWHRGATCPVAPDPCPISVVYDDVRDKQEVNGALLWNPIFDDFPQDARGRNTTVISLENNMAVPLLFAAVEDQGISYSECLNNQQTRFFKRGICRQKRPANYRLGPQQAVGILDPEFEGIFKPKEKEDDRFPPPPPPPTRELVPTVG